MLDKSELEFKRLKFMIMKYLTMGFVTYFQKIF